MMHDIILHGACLELGVLGAGLLRLSRQRILLFVQPLSRPYLLAWGMEFGNQTLYSGLFMDENAMMQMTFAHLHDWFAGLRLCQPFIGSVLGKLRLGQTDTILDVHFVWLLSFIREHNYFRRDWGKDSEKQLSHRESCTNYSVAAQLTSFQLRNDHGNSVWM